MDATQPSLVPVHDAAPADQDRRDSLRGWSPRASVALELLRALGSTALFPLRALDFLACRDALRGELLDDLRAHAAPAATAGSGPLPRRPLRLFVSCAETSGEIHATNWVRAIDRRLARAGAPRAEWSGFGGERLRAAGVRTLADPVSRATMGLRGALGNLPYYVSLLSQAASVLRGCDAALLVDSPALHGPMGRVAHRAGARVVQLVAPQLWAWAPWRARGWSRAVDQLLTILPFEPSWFERRAIRCVHVGHPLLDELQEAGIELEAAGRQGAPAGGELAVLPGSRRSVLRRNLPWMLDVCARLRERHPDARVSILAPDDARAADCLRIVETARAAAWSRVVSGDLHAGLARARAALSVSGTVLIDVLVQRLPCVAVYRLESRAAARLYASLVLSPWFAGPNLLAGREVVPEFGFASELGAAPAAQVVEALDRAWCDPAWRAACRRGLDQAARRLGPPGAIERAAAAALDLCGAEEGGA